MRPGTCTLRQRVYAPPTHPGLLVQRVLPDPSGAHKRGRHQREQHTIIADESVQVYAVSYVFLYARQSSGTTCVHSWASCRLASVLMSATPPTTSIAMPYYIRHPATMLRLLCSRSHISHGLLRALIPRGFPPDRGSGVSKAAPTPIPPSSCSCLCPSTHPASLLLVVWCRWSPPEQD